MTRLVAAIALLCACQSPPTLPAPGCWRPGRLRPGVLAEADIVAQCVVYSPGLQYFPREIQAAVVLHEVCHLRGHVTEYDADCCAARLYAMVYGVAAAIEVAEYWRLRRKDAVIPWLRCSDG